MSSPSGVAINSAGARPPSAGTGLASHSVSQAAASTWTATSGSADSRNSVSTSVRSEANAEACLEVAEDIVGRYRDSPREASVFLRRARVSGGVALCSCCDSHSIPLRARGLTHGDTAGRAAQHRSRRVPRAIFRRVGSRWVAGSSSYQGARMSGYAVAHRLGLRHHAPNRRQPPRCACGGRLGICHAAHGVDRIALAAVRLVDDRGCAVMNAPAPSRDAATSPAMMTGGTYHPSDGHQPPRLVFTPSGPCASRMACTRPLSGGGVPPSRHLGGRRTSGGASCRWNTVPRSAPSSRRPRSPISIGATTSTTTGTGRASRARRSTRARRATRSTSRSGAPRCTTSSRTAGPTSRPGRCYVARYSSRTACGRRHRGVSSPASRRAPRR